MQLTTRHAESLMPTATESPHALGDSADVLRQILQPGMNLCLWRRATNPAVSREVLPLGADQLPNVRCRTSPASFDDDVRALLQAHDLDPSAFPAWRTDLRRLADLYFGVSKGRAVTLRLETTASDGCRRFHVDRTELRLLCTYRGPGTQWLPDAQVDRVAQEGGAPNEDIVRGGEASQFRPYWVGILKGDAYPGNAGHGLVHRSPPISGTGQTRVLFCLDG